MILYYVHDPMCSWCWGFRPTWGKIQSALADNIEVKYLLGGLAPDTNEPMPESMQQDIAGYWKKIQRHIPGTRFNFDFWANCEPKRSTYPACRAVIAAKMQQPEIEQEMIMAIQTAYYLNAQNPSNNDTLIAIAKSLGLNEPQFKQDIDSTAVRNQLEKEITVARQMGANGFPSLILKVVESFYYIPVNYNDPQVTLEAIADRAS